MTSFEIATAKQIFEFGGGREAVITAEKAEILLQAVLELDPNHIRLSNKSFSSEAAIAISSRLIAFKGVEIADISDIIAGRPEEDALLTLKTICDSIVGNDLIELNVSDNALGSKGVTACQSVIICKTLQRLYFCNNGMSADACVLISELLLEGGCPPLTALHFYNNMSGAGGAVAIAEIVKACPSLNDFRFSATRTDKEGCLSIAQALLTLKSLKTLDLQDNSFSGKAGSLLAESLRGQPLLVYLNLRDAGLGADGISLIIGALMDTQQRLEYLDLSGNDMEAEQAEELSTLLQSPHMSGLKDLSIDDNEIGSEGAVFLAEGVKGLKSLETLSLCTCEVTAVGVYTLARSLAKLTKFATLKADGNQIFTRGVEEIQSLLLRSGIVLAEMEDNDEEGDEDGFEDALEAAEKERKEEEQAIQLQLQQQLQLQVQELKEENEKDKIVEEKLELDLAKVEDPPALNDEDDLISAMMTASLTGGAISDMPSPTDI
mmetsp:Transcript_22072/g.21330  ORF Transcript_22072/g.21330 Transcript_22072/m.21330 type:complete len:491 (-) Transcript_22072:355-1827(-)|eukprot:CAMPEP_0119051724 /NCGR_PEP_ID=MMETSP1177-20130426/73254_1 /TAXON_ID=2985 /ORGANISM="Ochromonas sp, Strain CCMP1899" /LENGTH=490 /DNA_ID=CAMNT_0007031039 /DNA_START=118 /DNA_END=1590 /DNA_ORIENTATION=-